MARDLFTSAVELPWRWVLIGLFLCFFGSWLVFAVLWWVVALAHGDLQPENIPSLQEAANWKPCVTEIYGFMSCFLFSMENQHTTGFGSRMPTEECPEAVFLMCAQAVVGTALHSAVLAALLAKLYLPRRRRNTILFSEKAVVFRRDGQLCLAFRVADIRKSHIIEARLNVLLMCSRVTPEGEVLTPHQRRLRLQASRFFLLWPETVVHRIDSRSPLFRLSPHHLRTASLEIVVLLEGTSEATDQRVQARYSYMANEILWGRRFSPIMMYNNESHTYDIHYSLLHATHPVDIPACSAYDMAVGEQRENSQPLAPSSPST